jgi:hypothetical protein
MKLSFPLIKNFHPNTISKAFILNAFVTALITVFTIEVRLYLDKLRAKKVKEDLGKAYIDVNLNNGKKIKVPIKDTQISGAILGISEERKLLITLGLSLIICLITYILMYNITGFGSGMLCFKDQCSTNKQIKNVLLLLGLTILFFIIFYITFFKLYIIN